jgi:hypothetical protein
LNTFTRTRCNHLIFLLLFGRWEFRIRCPWVIGGIADLVAVDIEDEDEDEDEGVDEDTTSLQRPLQRADHLGHVAGASPTARTDCRSWRRRRRRRRRRKELVGHWWWTKAAEEASQKSVHDRREAKNVLPGGERDRAASSGRERQRQRTAGSGSAAQPPPARGFVFLRNCRLPELAPPAEAAGGGRKQPEKQVGAGGRDAKKTRRDSASR